EDITEQIELDTGKKDNVVAEVLIRQQRKLLREKLNDIPDNYRDVIYGYYIAEKSYQQLAEEQNVQVKTIETKLYRARIWLKKHWKEEDFL
ncbi:sigma-70 family RNA polymerase sigma factor, partial [Streptomyces sp. NPDC057131]